VEPILKHTREKYPSTILRKNITLKTTIVAPGVFSPVVAKLAENIGFGVLYFSGGGFANLLGLPDLGTTTLTEVVDAVRHITFATSCPLIVDADTGFGEAVNVSRTARELEAAGAAAVHLEDQVMPKRCGHLDGKQLVDIDEMVKKIIVARASSDLVVIARTDARGVEGIDSAIERARAYIKAGAEIIFPEALESKQEFAEFSQKLNAPLLANMTEFGKTPYMTVTEFRRLGYRIIIFPMTAFRTMLYAVKETLQELYEVGTQRNLLKKMMPRNELYQLLDYYSYENLDKHATSRTLRQKK